MGFDRARALDVIEKALGDYEAGDGFPADQVVDVLAECCHPDMAMVQALGQVRRERDIAEARLAEVRKFCEANTTWDLGSLVNARTIVAILDGKS